ncbi:hypothetical protein KY339_04970 [Candidatus Woesearchaeota archaeon]|nr:hypothetical protein [Candidatus Woesearchaeota archaeon]
MVAQKVDIISESIQYGFDLMKLLGEGVKTVAEDVFSVSVGFLRIMNQFGHDALKEAVQLHVKSTRPVIKHTYKFQEGVDSVLKEDKEVLNKLYDFIGEWVPDVGIAGTEEEDEEDSSEEIHWEYEH